jgi:hypothetical protein
MVDCHLTYITKKIKIKIIYEDLPHVPIFEETFDHEAYDFTSSALSGVNEVHFYVYKLNQDVKEDLINSGRLAS